MKNEFDVVIVGAGFTGLVAAYKLVKEGKKVCVIESEKYPGGLAGTFEFADGTPLEKFYHHWFNNDLYVPKLLEELKLKEKLVTLPSKTGIYFNKKLWKLSSPLDLLKFNPLSIIDRFKLGMLLIKIRLVKDWKEIEHLTIREWLEPLCGKNVYKIVWEPLIQAKFSNYAESVNAVWMWKKLSLRGGTRNKKGNEELSYFSGGFGKVTASIVAEIERYGGVVMLSTPVKGVVVRGNKIQNLQTNRGDFYASQYLFTPALPIIAKIFSKVGPGYWLSKMNRVNYLGNLCLVLRLKNSLSDTYWMNVNDPSFPFVGVIEHTNFDSSAHYKDTHIVYLSRYLSLDDPLWKYSDVKYFNFALHHLKRMFPLMQNDWVLEYKIWRADYAQPITERNYSEYIVGKDTPYENCWVSTMAQIYPEDRGTNYAIREGTLSAKNILEKLEGAEINNDFL